MGSRLGNGSDCNMNSQTGVPWSPETNWIIAHGSLEASVTVESSDYAIAEPDRETTICRLPLVLKPLVPDFSPCEIKICFGKKYDVGQIYVRSTARVYEVYYAQSLHCSNEYLCTVKCGVAERDEKLLQTSSIKDVEEHSECLSGESSEESIADGENVVTSEEEWVKIKVLDIGTSSVADKIYTNRMANIQDLYEATAQINGADPCSVLTIRLLSLQDKCLLYVDEVYVFVDPVRSTDSGTEEVLPGSSTQSSLMAMFVPTLLQMSKSSVRQLEDKQAPVEVLKENKMESGSRRTDVGLEINQVNEQYVKPKEVEKDIPKEPVNIKDSPPGHLEIALEQLISRVSRVEDIFLRFEQKLMKPIESIEARLQRVEDQLQILSDNSKYYVFPHCMRICAPTFTCSESNSSSFHNEQSDFPACEASEHEKNDFSCDNTPKLSHDAKIQPSLIVSAPEFPCDEDEEGNDDLEPKRTLSVDDALAAALNGFLSSAIIQPSAHSQATSQSCQSKTQEFRSEENVNGDSLGHAQGLTCRSPEFFKQEIENEEHLNYTQSFLHMASKIKNSEQDHSDFESAPHVDLPAALEVNKINGYFVSANTFNSVETSNEFKPDQEKDSVEARKNEINDFYSETNPGKRTNFDPDDNDDMASKQAPEHVSESVSEVPESYAAEEMCFKENTPNASKSSCASMLDFEFPILEVKFIYDVCAITKSPLEALLDRAAESNTEQINDVILDGNGITDLLTINDVLIDTGVSVADGSSQLEGGPDVCAPEINASLI